MRISWLEGHGLDPTPAQVRADRARRVRLVTPDRVGARARAPDRTRHAEHMQKGQPHWVTSLPGRDHRGQPEPAAIDEVMALRPQATAGATDAVIRRLESDIRVIRPSAL